MGGGYENGYDDWGGERRERSRNYRDYDDKQESHHRSSYSRSRRSSEYPTEDSYSRRSYDKHQSSRDDRRSRSRSRERSSSDRKQYSQREGKSCDKYASNNDRQNREVKANHESNDEQPNKTLMARSLPLWCTEQDISAEINKYGVYPKQVRLMKVKETGASKGFAFIEFATVEEATQLKELTKGFLGIDADHECSLHYSFNREPKRDDSDKKDFKLDWACPKCGVNNFKRRDECFKCGANREGNGGIPDYDSEISLYPTNTLILYNLPLTCTEERILTVIGSLTLMPIKSLRISNDVRQFTANLCYLEFNSVGEATQLMTIISEMNSDFVIDDAIIRVAFGNRKEKGAVKTMAKALASNAAMAALAAAQWHNLGSKSDGGQSSSSGQPPVAAFAGDHFKHAAPNYNLLQYDATSGFYYDATTGFYYDSTSQYFYNSQTQKYMYYDTVQGAYIAVNNDGQAVSQAPVSGQVAAPANSQVSTPSSTSSKQNKVKTAQQIAKDMEKWAKSLNQKKEMSVRTTNPSLDTSAHFELSMANEVHESTSSSQVVQSVAPSESSSLLSSVDEVEQTPAQDPFQIIKEEEEKLLDFDRLACLLCKRQFTSLELMTKHQSMSELHKSNMAALRSSLLNDDQLEHMANVERELAYRDRAKERRQKHGFDDTPEFSQIREKFESKKDEVMSEMSAPALPISGNNIGSKMMKAMGWREGKGLGKSNQGVSDIIQLKQNRAGLGLGSAPAPVQNPGETYKDAVKRTAMLRFKEMYNS